MGLLELIHVPLGVMELPGSGPILWNVLVQVPPLHDGEDSGIRVPWLVAVPRTRSDFHPNVVRQALDQYTKHGVVPTTKEFRYHPPGEASLPLRARQGPRALWQQDRSAGERWNLHEALEAVNGVHQELLDAVGDSPNAGLKCLHRLAGLRPICLLVPEIRAAAAHLVENLGHPIHQTGPAELLEGLRGLPRPRGRPPGPTEQAPDELTILELTKSYGVATGHRVAHALLGDMLPKKSDPRSWVKKRQHDLLQKQGLKPYAVPLVAHPIPVQASADGAFASARSKWLAAAAKWCCSSAAGELVTICSGSQDLASFTPAEVWTGPGEQERLPWASHRYSSSQSSSSSSGTSS
jgi:hypothetical protein